ncbi:MAG TPA: aminotransferase class I/II-fold pyridoxal phosphate-dependent enzyme [Acidimicrobiales bacterium]|nr:aminotransferase class I/II-fold pyridoxal phosphate-dependent enzyme [Acidimicrobiales bacterium]
MPPYPLEPGGAEFGKMVEAAVDLIGRFVDGLADAPASDLDLLDPVLELVGEGPGQAGRPLEELLDTVERAAAKGFETAGPGYLAFVPAGGLLSAALADLVACALNRFTGLAGPAPGLVALEASVLRWMCDQFDLPAGAAGLLTSGGSLANLTALVAARASRLGEDFQRGTLYASPQAHHSVAKAARLAGFPPSAVRAVPCTADLRMDLDALASTVDADRKAGRLPFLLVGSGGTTNTGTVDPLTGMVEMARRFGLWLHVDAAYGGFFQLTDRGRRQLRGIEGADSIALDPHKGLFLPYGTGALLVRDGEHLRAAHSGVAPKGDYMQDIVALRGVQDFADYGPELSRDFRGLRVWLPLHLHGVAAFRAALDEKLDLARHAYGALSATDGLEVPWPPDLSIVAFRAGAGDEDTRRLLKTVNATRRVLLSSTGIEGRRYVRMAILSFRTHLDRVEEAVELIRGAL